MTKKEIAKTHETAGTLISTSQLLDETAEILKNDQAKYRAKHHHTCPQIASKLLEVQSVQRKIDRSYEVAMKQLTKQR